MFISDLDFYFQFGMDVSTLSQSQICELNRFIFLSIRRSIIQNLRSEIILSPGFHWKQLGKYRLNHWIYRMLCLSQTQISTFSSEWMFQHYLSLRFPLLFRNESLDLQNVYLSLRFQLLVRNGCFNIISVSDFHFYFGMN